MRAFRDDSQLGDSTRFNRLFVSILPGLRRLARRRIKGERAGHTLQSGDLVHRVWLRLRLRAGAIADSAHLFRRARRVMTWILADHGRGRNVREPRGDRRRVPLEPISDPRQDPERRIESLALDEALAKLEGLDRRAATVVRMRREGYSIREISERLRISSSSVEKDYAHCAGLVASGVELVGKMGASASGREGLAMTPDRRERAKSIFDRARALPPDQHRPFVERECAGDDALRDEILELLDHDARAGRDGFLSAGGTGEPGPGSGTAPPSGEAYDSALLETPNIPFVYVSRIRPTPGKTVSAPPLGRVVGFSPDEGLIDEPQLYWDLQKTLRRRLLGGAWIYAWAFLLFSAWDTFSVETGDFWARARLASEWIVALAALASVPIFRFWKDCPVEWMYRITKVVLFATAAFLTCYEVENLRAEGWLAAAEGGKLAAVLEPTVDSIAFRWFVILVAYGFFVPDPAVGPAPARPDRGPMDGVRRKVLRLVMPRTRANLGTWLNAITVWSLVLALLVAAWDGTFLLVIGPWFELALWLVVARAMASYGTYRLMQVETQAAEARELGMYRIERQLAEGGMGAVYFSRHPRLKRPCALKTIRPDQLSDAAIRRFEQEVQTTAALQHPNIVTIYDYGRTNTGVHYYVMEYLEGPNLSRLVRAEGPLPPGRVVHLLRQVALALAEAHWAGAIHRDIKPSNIITARVGRHYDCAKLLDFGLVKPVSGSEAGGVSGRWQVLGTPDYMSPEQARGPDVDHRCDIYSLGAVSYFLLTGKPPFGGHHWLDVIDKHLREDVTPPSRLRPEVPAELEAVVLRCLQKDPADRYQDADALAEALAGCDCWRRWTDERQRAWWEGYHHHPGRPSGHDGDRAARQPVPGMGSTESAAGSD